MVYPSIGGEIVDNEDGTWSPVEFTYVEFSDDESEPYLVVECEYSRSDAAPRVAVVHMISRDDQREVRSSDFRGVSLEDVIQAAWLAITHRPARVGEAETATPAEVLADQQAVDEDDLSSAPTPRTTPHHRSVA